MPHRLKTLALAALLAGTVPAYAGPVTIDFEGVTSYASIGDYYAGGNDGAGVSGTARYGASFSGAALALSNDALGPYFSNAPSGGSVLFASDASALMNVASGFSGQLSFWYSAANATADAVRVYGGLDGSGALLGSVALAGTAQLGCSDMPFCHWQRAVLAFDGTARSVSFGADPGLVAFDDVTITPVPEPTTAALLGLGLAGVMLARRRAARD